MSGPAIDMQDVSFRYGERTAISGVSLQVESGTIFTIVGPNGAGKTTLMKLLLGLFRPAAGSVYVLGFDAAAEGDEIRQRSAALLEHHGLYERLSAEANLEFHARVWRLTAEERRRRIGDLLTNFDLWDRRRDLAGTWSRGMKQKLAIALALLHQPKLLFLDEPTAGLDPLAAADLRKLVADLAGKEGITLFMSTHNLHEAEEISDRIAVLREGRVIACGRPAEIARMYAGVRRILIVARGVTEAISQRLRALPEVITVSVAPDGLTVQLTPGTGLASVIQYLATSGVLIDDVRDEQSDLERAFFRLMEKSE